MGVTLAKGGNVSLTKEAPGLTSVIIGLGWDVRTTTGADHDLDASAILCDATGRVLTDQHFVFFNNLRSPDGSVELHIGPKAPAGQDSNWIPTDSARKFELMFRLYGPKPEFAEKKWVLPDVEQVVAQ